MGITKFSYDTLIKYGGIKSSTKMMELGDQNLYFHPFYGQYAKPTFIKLDIDHTSVDLHASEGGALPVDLSKPFNKKEWKGKFDVITNFGTSEHVSDSLYHCFKNVHESCKVGGKMFHENPKTGNWPGHGAHYMTEAFYIDLAKKAGYDILGIGEHPAMGNTTDGWNIWCVLLKKGDTEFISEKEFNRLDFRKS